MAARNGATWRNPKLYQEMTEKEFEETSRKLFEMFIELYGCKRKITFTRGEVLKFFKAGFDSGLKRNNNFSKGLPKSDYKM